jgi:hypothetical protein
MVFFACGKGETTRLDDEKHSGVSLGMKTCQLECGARVSRLL